ncbi:MAG: right-handed parallel beta-helix repeat-containing protein [Polyangiaceae bacterium]
MRWLACASCLLACSVRPSSQQPLIAAPSSAATLARCEAPLGFTTTRGGVGGELVRVTSLAAEGEGSLAAALARSGPRVVVFEVGGVIDLAGRSLNVTEPYVSVAGQTAPAPGVTLIRGGLQIRTHDVVVQHLRVRPGEAGHDKRDGWEVDGISTGSGAADVIVDHCSLSWATDENLSASGARFNGETPDAWRASTSHRITFSHNIVAEGLSNSTHRKGEHSKGTLIHDNVTDAAVIGNLYLSNVERSPYFKGGARGVVVNNWIVNPVAFAMKYALIADEWGEHAYQVGQMAIVGNVFDYGPNTRSETPLLLAGGAGQCELYLSGNELRGHLGMTPPLVGGARELLLMRERAPLWPATLRPLATSEVRASLSQNAGARPWDRDVVDQRVLREAGAATGHIVNDERQGGGYPEVAPTRAPFHVEGWDLRCLTQLPASAPQRAAR